MKPRNNLFRVLLIYILPHVFASGRNMQLPVPFGIVLYFYLDNKVIQYGEGHSYILKSGINGMCDTGNLCVFKGATKIDLKFPLGRINSIE